MKPIVDLNVMETVAILHAAGDTTAANRIERICFLRLARRRLREARAELLQARSATGEEFAASWLRVALASFESADYWRAQARGLTEDVRRRPRRRAA